MRLLPVLLLPVAACVGTSEDDSGGADFAHNDMEVALHELVNDHRESVGLARFELHTGFSSLAREHSEDMARGRVEFGHAGAEERFDQMFALEDTAVSTGENVAWVSTGWPDPADVVVQGWLDSQGHRENIEGSYTHSGMGAAQDSDGGWYATQLFCLIP
jgi:uncharacterized protein YkwD